MAGTVIRETQFDALRQKRQQDFSKKVSADLRANRPDLVSSLSDRELQRRVDFGIRRARSYGMVKLYSIAMFVELMFLIGPNFDEYPEAAAVFSSPQVHPDRKVDRVIETMNEQQWQEARRMSNPAAWNAQ